MTASLADKIHATAEATRVVKIRCSVCALSSDWLEGIHGARDQHGTTYTGIIRALKAEGIEVNVGSLKNHFQNHR